MKKTAFTLKPTKQSKGFTLIEVIVVVIIISLVFSVLSFALYSSIKNSIETSKSAEDLKQKTLFFWDTQRKFYTSNYIYLKDNLLTLYNTAGNNQGLVKSTFFLKDGFLWYYEFPFVYGDPSFYDEKNAVKLFKVKDIKMYAVKDNQQFFEFQGLPDYLVIEIDGIRMVLRWQSIITKATYKAVK